MGLAGAGGLLTFTTQSTFSRRPIAVDSRLDETEKRHIPPGEESIDLPVEVVREWRSGMGRIVTNHGGIEAYSKWDLAILLSDIARENGFYVDQKHVFGSMFLTNLKSISKV